MEDRYNDMIVVNEVKNDGGLVHLYFDPTKKNYQAFGISAYVITHVVPSIFPTYSDEHQMPMVEIEEDDIKKIGKKLEEIIYIENEYYQFEAKGIYHDDDYGRWASEVRGTKSEK